MENQICTKCGIEKPLEEYYLRNEKTRHKNTRHRECKSCFSERTKSKRDGFVEDCINYLGGKCLICGRLPIKEAQIMDFHHKDPTKKDFLIPRGSSYSKKKVLEELNKCDLLCCNCHRELHSKDKFTQRIEEDVSGKKCSKCDRVLPLDGFYKSKRKSRKERKEGIKGSLEFTYTYCKDCQRSIVGKKRYDRKHNAVALKGGKCIYCGYDKCEQALEFHHLKDKDEDITKMMKTSSWKQIEEELEKCILLCSICHRIEHHYN